MLTILFFNDRGADGIAKRSNLKAGLFNDMSFFGPLAHKNDIAKVKFIMIYPLKNDAVIVVNNFKVWTIIHEAYGAKTTKLICRFGTLKNEAVLFYIEIAGSGIWKASAVRPISPSPCGTRFLIVA